MKQCFGAMYPDLSSLPFNQTVAGKVFSVRINSLGLVHQAPVITCDMAAWESCQMCEFYCNCYDLSNAKLAMQQAIKSAL